MDRLSGAYKDLHPKFHPFCIGHSLCQDPVAEHAKNVFDAWKAYHDHLAPLKSDQKHIIDIGEFFLKRARSQKTTEKPTDTHIHRVSKAAKMRAYITRKGLESYFVVPKKFILKMETGELVVIAQKIPHKVGEAHLSHLQAIGLAELIFLGLLNPFDAQNRVLVDLKGRIAILDTAPFGRQIKVAIKQYWIGRFIFNKTMPLSRKLCATARLKSLCAPIEQTKIEEVETRNYREGMKHSVSRAALSCLSLCLLPTVTSVTSSLSINSLVVSTVYVGFIGLASIKILSCVTQALSIHQVYMTSLERERGLPEIEEMVRSVHPSPKAKERE